MVNSLIIVVQLSAVKEHLKLGDSELRSGSELLLEYVVGVSILRRLYF